MFPTDVVIVAGMRTPMARYTGLFSDVSAIDLGAHAAKVVVQKSGVPAEDFDHVVFGNVLQTSADAIYGARHVALKAGLKMETPAVTVNRLCGSGIGSFDPRMRMRRAHYDSVHQAFKAKIVEIPPAAGYEP